MPDTRPLPVIAYADPVVSFGVSVRKSDEGLLITVPRAWSLPRMHRVGGQSPKFFAVAAVFLLGALVVLVARHGIGAIVVLFIIVAAPLIPVAIYAILVNSRDVTFTVNENFLIIRHAPELTEGRPSPEIYLFREYIRDIVFCEQSTCLVIRVGACDLVFRPSRRAFVDRWLAGFLKEQLLPIPATPDSPTTPSVSPAIPPAPGPATSHPTAPPQSDPADVRDLCREKPSV